MEHSLTEERMSIANSTRRRFIGRIARGSVGLAVLPATGLLPHDASTATPLPQRPARPDEAYWRQVKAQFPLRDGVLPLNAANLCPAPRTVVDAVTSGMRDVEGDVSFQNRAKYDTLRETVRDAMAAHLGATADEIAIVRNTSEGNNVIVNGVPLESGDDVLLFDQNHPTNNVAWDVRAARVGFTVRRITLEEPVQSVDRIVAQFRDTLTPRTRVIAFSDVSNTTGVRMPTRELCLMARERGIHAHVDGAQTWGALVRDLHDLGCDSYAASAHKWLMGPKEAGVLYVRQDRIAEIAPSIVGIGWGNSAETSARGARKFETLGQRNDAIIAALQPALAFHELIGPEVIEARILELAAALKDGLRALPGAHLVTPEPEELSAGVVIVRFDGADMRAVYERLYSDHGLAAAPTGGLRFSPQLYVTLADVERTVEAVAMELGG
jgi:selenocysteine lyase/cysteine desulfurase